MLQANGDAAWFGWPKDDTIEALRAQWIKAETFGERRQLAAAIQRRAFETVPYISTGQWKQMTAYRRSLKGIVSAPAFLMLEYREGVSRRAVWSCPRRCWWRLRGSASVC
jgi:ABC-type transport system substrate-binding protein